MPIRVRENGEERVKWPIDRNKNYLYIEKGVIIMWGYDNKDIVYELMSIIDKWTVDNKDYKEGSGRFLSDKLLLRHSILTNSRRIGAKSVKNMLFHDVLEIYPKDNSSKVGYSNFIKDEKYDYKFDKLEILFDRDNNYYHMLHDFPGFLDAGIDGDDLDEILEGVLEAEIPYSLLECISYIVHDKFKKYWEAARYVTEVEDDDKSQKLKDDAHDECIVAAALFEIFIKEYAEEALSIAMKNVYENDDFEMTPETGRGVVVTRLVFKCYAAIVAVMLMEKAQYYTDIGDINMPQYYWYESDDDEDSKEDLATYLMSDKNENRNSKKKNSKNNMFIEWFLKDYAQKNDSLDDVMKALYEYMSFDEEDKSEGEAFSELYDIIWRLMQPLWDYGSGENKKEE